MAAAVGASLALPGPRLDGDSLIKLINRTEVTHALGVPTIWMGLLDALDRSGQRIDTLTRCIIGGAAMSPSLMAAYRDRYGVELLHGWGMTEMSPIGTVNRLLSKHASLDQGVQDKVRHAQGRPPYGVDMRVVDEDGAPLPHDGAAIGALHVRGPWIVDGYFQTEVSALTDDGWFDTGDIAAIDADGYMRIHDRAKDVIKSGGEWISTVELENIAMSHPNIKQAAAIAVPHPKWDERPVLVVVADASEADILAHFEGKVAKWQIPDRVIFVETLPLGSTGKVLKTDLRQTYAKLFKGQNNA